MTIPTKAPKPTGRKNKTFSLKFLVKLAKEEEKTVGGIILPGTSSKDNSNTGEVIAMGRHEKLDEIKIGDKIVYSKDAGTLVKDGEDKYLILNIEDILAVIS